MEIIENLKLLNNLVLLKPIMDNDMIQLSNGQFIYIDTRYEKEKHAPVRCEVVKIPKNLIYHKTSGVPWRTKIEIKHGDIAYVNYIPVLNGLDSSFGRKIYDIENDITYILVEYNEIFLVTRENRVIMINDYTLIESLTTEYNALEKRLSEYDLVLPQQLKNKYDVKFGIIRYKGSPVEYLHKEWKCIEDINIGDTVVLNKHADIALEYDLHKKLDGKKYYRVQTRDILCKLENNK